MDVNRRQHNRGEAFADFNGDPGTTNGNSQNVSITGWSSYNSVYGVVTPDGAANANIQGFCSFVERCAYTYGTSNQHWQETTVNAIANDVLLVAGGGLWNSATGSTHTTIYIDTINALGSMVVGQTIIDADSDIPSATTIAAIDPGGCTAPCIQLSQAATGSHTADVLTYGIRGTTTSTSTTISSIASIPTNLAVNQVVSGPGIPLGDFITAVGSTTITLAQPATASATVELTYGVRPLRDVTIDYTVLPRTNGSNAGSYLTFDLQSSGAPDTLHGGFIQNVRANVDIDLAGENGVANFASSPYRKVWNVALGAYLQNIVIGGQIKMLLQIVGAARRTMRIALLTCFDMPMHLGQARIFGIR